MTFDLRPVGQTAVTVTSLGLGCASIGNLGHAVSDADAAAVLEQAWVAGIRYFDTAPHYGRGRSEARLGAFLKGKTRGDYVLSTKVGKVLRPGQQVAEADGFVDPLPNAAHYEYTAEALEEALTGSLERLGTGHVDILYVHDIGTMTHGAANERHFDDLMTSGLPYLRKLKAEGKVGAIGLGVNETRVCIDVLKSEALDVILLAGRLTLLDRDAEAELVGLARETGTSFVLGGIYNSGILAKGAVPGAWFNYQPASEEILAQVRELDARAKAEGTTLPQAAMQFALTRPGEASVLIGTSSLKQLEQNLNAANSALSPEAAQRLFS